MRLLNRLVSFIIGFTVKTPFYPYWLIFNIADRGNLLLLKHAKGIVLNVGCGADDKREIIENLNSVKTYITSDYPGWDANWQEAEKQSKIFGKFNTLIYRSFNRKPDIWTDGNNLPFKDSCIDTVISQGVLEHISDQERFLSEHQRVLTKSGLLLLTTPLIYESHGGNPPGKDDYVRYTEYGLRNILSRSGFKIISILPYGNFGTAVSQLINSFIIKRIFSCSRLLVIFFLPLALLLFLFINIVCYLVDKIGADMCYTAGFFTVAQPDTAKSMNKYPSINAIFRCPKCHKSLVKRRFCRSCKRDYLNADHGPVLIT